MKRILLVMLAVVSSSVLFGQAQLENPGFEGIWEDVTGTEDEPVEWSSLKTGTGSLAGLAPIVAWKESATPHSGSYCIRLKVASAFGINSAGLLTNGRVNVPPLTALEEGNVHTNESDAKWHTVFNDRPDSLVVWVKHIPVSGDKSKVHILLHDDSEDGELPHDGSTANWVGQCKLEVIPTYNSWTRLSYPFHYFNNNTPDYILCVLSAGDSLNAVQNTEMYVDDIQLIYNPLSTAISPSGQQTFDACVNGPSLTITENTNAGVTTAITREWKWSTTMGGPYSSFGTPETGTSYTPLFTSIGTYYIICETDFGSQGVITSNEVELVVTSGTGDVVSISPVAAQNINEMQDGTNLTATECPTTSTRDWKWTTTSGSGYQSFSPVETGSTYTPNFATAGTYYVICESDFSGNLVSSNEVTIIVAPEGTGINEQGISFNIFNAGEYVQVVYESAANIASFDIVTLDGKSVYTTSIGNGLSQHTINAVPGIYIYRVIEGNKIVTGKIKL